MGRATALAFAKEGACVVINDIDEEGLSSTVDDVQAIGGAVTAIKGDVTKNECVAAIVGRALEQYGKVDILFNYVGGSPGCVPMTLFTEKTPASNSCFIPPLPVEELGPSLFNLHNWMRKIKNAFDPNDISDTTFYISAKEK